MSMSVSPNLQKNMQKKPQQIQDGIQKKITLASSLCLQTIVNVNVNVAHLAALLVTTCSVVWLRLRHHGGSVTVCIYNKEGSNMDGEDE